MDKKFIQEKILIPIVNTKVFKQRDHYSCGPRALQTVLYFFGIEPKFPEIKRKCKTDVEGTYVSEIAKAATYFGLNVKEENGDIKKLRKYLDNGYLVIIMWYTGSVSRLETAHSVVVYDYDETYFFSWDPDSNLCTVPITIINQKELQFSWKRKGEDFAWMVALKKEETGGKGRKETKLSKSKKRRIVPRMRRRQNGSRTKR